MAVMSIEQIASVAANAGFSGPDLDTAVAIALAETLPPGNSDSYNPEPGAKGGTPAGEGSYGLWQIYVRMHPEFDPSQLSDPQYNADAAFSVYQKAGNSFIPWSTFKYGKYQTFLPQVQAVLGTAPSPGDSGDGGSAPPNAGTLATIVTVGALVFGLVTYFRS